MPPRLHHRTASDEEPSTSRHIERWLFAVLVAAFIVSAFVLVRRFYVTETVFVPKTGGTYIEGSVGELKPLMPWFAITNDVNRDIGSMVFAGLLKYNPETKLIEEDLAQMTMSNEGRVYTLRLKENTFAWHDSTLERPHYVTADDVLFTFKTIQQPDFPNQILAQNFLGVAIEKLDVRTVRFTLEEPYNFFPSNLTLGLVPQRSFEGIPVGRIDQALDFAFHPIGAGPYAFKSLVQTELSTEVTLERFPQPSLPVHRLERVVFRIFPDYATLLSDIRNLSGVRLVPRNKDGDPIVSRNFRALNYVLPQYVALFLNLDRPFLQDQKLRLGLQLGTNKQEIVDTIDESMIVDTPLLEIDVSDWRYQFDPNAAQGALFSSNWHLPEKVRLQRLLERKEANDTGVLRIESIVLLDTGAVLTITGSLVNVGTGGTVNGIAIERHPTTSGAWIVALPTNGNTGALALGDNLVRLMDSRGKIVDSFYVWRTARSRDFKLAAEEQNLVDLFVASREGEVEPEHRITFSDLFLEKGMLRKRLSTDPVDIRVNENGDRLSLILVTSKEPPVYGEIAELIKKQWGALGVHVGIEIPETRDAFEDRLLTRDYDILLYGQSLLDNLDSYPYWHSSGVQKRDTAKHALRIDAYNLSQYSSLQADSLLEIIRETTDEKERQESLTELRDVLKNDVPAIFLYSPLYTFAYEEDIHGVELKNLSLHSDRFLTLYRWYTKRERVFQPGRSWFSLFPWLFGGFRE